MQTERIGARLPTCLDQKAPPRVSTTSNPNADGNCVITYSVLPPNGIDRRVLLLFTQGTALAKHQDRPRVLSNHQIEVDRGESLTQRAHRVGQTEDVCIILHPRSGTLLPGYSQAQKEPHVSRATANGLDAICSVYLLRSV